MYANFTLASAPHVERQRIQAKPGDLPGRVRIRFHFDSLMARFPENFVDCPFYLKLLNLKEF